MAQDASFNVAQTSAVIALATDSLLPPNPRLDNALTNSATHGLRPIQVTPLAGQLLAIQAQLVGAKSVLEIGVLGGYSTIWFAEAGARVTGIEIDARHRDIALENVKGLDVDILLGDALEVLPRLAAERRVFDFVFIDASWETQWEYFDWAVKLTRPRGAIYVDNVVRALVENETLDKTKESLVTRVGRDERVRATLVPTVFQQKSAENEVDGFLLAIVN
ncbi:O-methyltransferase [Lasiosphaeria miniovina]|uniref:O-methyltransferase n=1 Tax=Lasiosphaeria miniovina TaxID=1954250 RepID=A0AA40ACJ5_9PEZI|nr:O-methyltransferase [Lasiosphaeria miniovina]KAK0713401.1 O-methyltransferase [Lasiosphaeria miniovina]